jgi:hypothetical protein
VLRYYIRVAGKIIWADRPEELIQDLPQPKELPPDIDPPRPISVSLSRRGCSIIRLCCRSIRSIHTAFSLFLPMSITSW